ncbi:diguanylate cyclase domain-containing protein [Pseudohoeflea coraliihabitans]|uniref:Diguanylate cyclase n=1 Tax=Pseudohoeflea coraliihabitans TaxID=2860393 RepID=A0ABS6WJ31_9HYPH|nr:diguanylate cyclase [Pseudohoeflea sp. DP4N28-3]MBW3095936.1 diguanylate cyclase [Pseudohoeflea sp. DP4N28-3]
MMLKRNLPDMGWRYAFAGSALGAVAPLAFAAGALASAGFSHGLLAFPAMAIGLAATTALATGGIGGVMASRFGRQLERRARFAEAERAGTRDLYHTAYHDALTGLGNRHALSRDFPAFAAPRSDAAERTADQAVVLVMDLDRFKFINDTMGHLAGDAVLRALTTRLRDGCGRDSRIYRLGGDEFVILMQAPGNQALLAGIVRELIQGVFRPVHHAGTEIETAGSIGITFCPVEGDSLSACLRRADLALYEAKEAAGAAYCFYTDEMERDDRSRRRTELDLRQGVESGALRIDYQPILEAGSLQPRAYRAQIGWTHPEHGEIAPQLFMAMARESGTMALVEQWHLRQVLDDAAGWPAEIAVVLRISVEEVARPSFASQFAQMLSQRKVAATRIVFEVEFGNASARLIGQARGLLETLQAMGVRIAAKAITRGAGDLDPVAAEPVGLWQADLNDLRAVAKGLSLSDTLKAVSDLAAAVGVQLCFQNVDSEGDLALVSQLPDALVDGRIAGPGLSNAEVAAMAGIHSPPAVLSAGNVCSLPLSVALAAAH